LLEISRNHLFSQELVSYLQRNPQVRRFEDSIGTFNSNSKSNHNNNIKKEASKINFSNFFEKEDNKKMKNVVINSLLRSKNTDINQGSLTKESTKIKCNCKKTKCLKLYCECFSSLGFCDGCNCEGCMNTEGNAERERIVQLIKSKKNNAFKNDKEETKANNVIGCNCAKSYCVKKYCECFHSGKKCTEQCRCLECKNRVKSNTKKEKKSLFPNESNANNSRNHILYKGKDILGISNINNSLNSLNCLQVENTNSICCAPDGMTINQYDSQSQFQKINFAVKIETPNDNYIDYNENQNNNKK